MLFQLINFNWFFISLYHIVIDCFFLNWLVIKFNYFYRLILRIRCDAEKAQCPLGEKFGCDPIYEAPKLLQQARHLKLNVIFLVF